MSDVITNVNYTTEFIEKLQEDISRKIAKFTNKKNSYRKLDIIQCHFYNSDIINLSNYNEILTAILQCSSCYKDMDIESIIGKVKNLLNKV